MKNLFSPFVVIFLFSCSVLTAQERITNGDFTKGTAGWAIETHNGTTGTFDIDSSGLLNGISSAHIMITNSDGTDWHLQFQQIVGAITAGDKYHISFQAEASTAATISYWIQQYHGNYNILRQMSFNITTGKQTFQDSLSIDSTDSNVKIGFVIGALATGSEVWFDAVSMIKTNPTSVDINQSRTVPVVYSLMQNYPNPFNPSTTIQYVLPAGSYVKLYVYNTLGQVVKELNNSEQAVGYHSVTWNANVASGMYFYRMEATEIGNPNNRFIDTKKMMLLK